jgi:hypothetical protein
VDHRAPAAVVTAISGRPTLAPDNVEMTVSRQRHCQCSRYGHWYGNKLSYFCESLIDSLSGLGRKTMNNDGHRPKPCGRQWRLR